MQLLLFWILEKSWDFVNSMRFSLDVILNILIRVKSVRILNFSDDVESIVTKNFYEILELVFVDDRFSRIVDCVCEQKHFNVLEFKEKSRLMSKLTLWIDIEIMKYVDIIVNDLTWSILLIIFFESVFISIEMIICL
jgi:hypothetical protein